MERLPKVVETIFQETRQETRLSCIRMIRDLAAESENRETLSLSPGLIEAVCFLLSLDTGTSIESRIHELALDTIKLLLLEDPAIDTLFVHEEACVANSVRLLKSPTPRARESAATVLDYLLVCESHRPRICSQPDIVARLCAIVNDMPEQSKGFVHALQALVYLSTVQSNLFAMAREQSLPSTLLSLLHRGRGKFGTQMRVLNTIDNLCFLPENHLVFAEKQQCLGQLLSLLEVSEPEVVEVAKAILDKFAANPQIRL